MVTQAFLWKHQSIGRLGLEQPLSARRFSEGYTSRGFSLKLPATLPPSSSVRRSQAALNPGAYLSCQAVASRKAQCHPR